MLIDLFHKTRESSERIKHIKPKKESGHFCKVCGTQLDSVKYGKNLYVCPHCGARLQNNVDGFCPYCGSDLQQ